MIDINQMLQIRRAEDAGNDLWSVFNRVQENLLQGGILTVTPKDNGKVRRSRSKSDSFYRSKLRGKQNVMDSIRNYDVKRSCLILRKVGRNPHFFYLNIKFS